MRTDAERASQSQRAALAENIIFSVTTVRLTSIHPLQIEAKSHMTAAGLTNLFMVALTRLLSELVNTTIKSHGTMGSWPNIWLQLDVR